MSALPDASVMEANASRYRGKAPDEIAWAEPERQTRAVKKYLAALEAETEPNPDRKLPKVISPSDPSSAWTAKANKRVQFGYGLNYLIDISDCRCGGHPQPKRMTRSLRRKTMIKRTDERLGLKPKRARRRHRLWHRQVPQLADRSWYHTAYPSGT
jgi:hypothetical protein